MTDQLDSRTMGTVTAFMDETEHPLRRSTFTPAEGVTIAPEAVEIPSEAVELDVRAEAEEPADSEPDLGFPKPPERGSLDDDDLVPLVGRHTEDTATVDLIGILQAQMQLRAAEAAKFAAWEAQIRRIGTEEALDELERTRLHFTGVIPIQTGPTFLAAPAAPPVLATTAAPSVVATPAAPAGSALVPERLSQPEPEASVIPAGTAPRTAPSPDEPTNAHVERARLADDELLERADEAPAVESPASSTTSGRRILVACLSIVALAVIAASVILFPVGASVDLVAALAAVAVLAAGWVGIVAGRLALRSRTRVTAPVTGRTAWAVAAGLVVGTAVGEGIVRSTASAFAWQGYLLTLMQVHDFHVELSIVAGLVASLALAFVIVVLADRGRATSTAS